jgi:hypothetical protein
MCFEGDSNTKLGAPFLAPFARSGDSRLRVLGISNCENSGTCAFNHSTDLAEDSESSLAPP